MSWSCHGHVLVLSRAFLVLSRPCPGLVKAISWSCQGHFLVLSRVCPGPVKTVSWSFEGHVLVLVLSKPWPGPSIVKTMSWSWSTQIKSWCQQDYSRTYHPGHILLKIPSSPEPILTETLRNEHLLFPNRTVIDFCLSAESSTYLQ